MSTSGGSAWSEIDVTMDDGYAVALPSGAVLQAGCWMDTAGLPSKPAVFRTTNDGVSWQRTSLYPEQGVIRTMAVAPTSLSTVYAAGYSYNSTVGTRARIFKSTNAGVNWTRIGAATFDAVGQTIEAVIVDPFNASRVFAGTSGGIYRSTDAGSTWAKQAQSFYAKALVSNTATSGRFYAGSSTGVWESTDGGQNWVMINNGLTALSVLSLAFDGTSRKLFAGTDGGGVFRLDLLTGVPESPAEIPAAFALEQNYPNPFNPLTTIGFRTAEAGMVKLRVFDLLGREVATLVHQRLAAGVHTARFDATGLSTGMYVYRLEVIGPTRKFLDTKTMALVR